MRIRTAAGHLSKVCPKEASIQLLQPWKPPIRETLNIKVNLRALQSRWRNEWLDRNACNSWKKSRQGRRRRSRDCEGTSEATNPESNFRSISATHNNDQCDELRLETMQIPAGWTGGVSVVNVAAVPASAFRPLAFGGPRQG